MLGPVKWLWGFPLIVSLMQLIRSVISHFIIHKLLSLVLISANLSTQSTTRDITL